jgi:hypothetical protein
VVDEHAVAVEAAQLLHHHRVGAVGDGRAGEDAGGGARRQRVADAAGRDALGDHQPRAGGGHVGTAQRVAVHRRVVEGRHVEAGDLVDREHPPEGFGGGHLLDGGERRGGSQQGRAHVLEGTHGLFHVRP